MQRALEGMLEIVTSQEILNEIRKVLKDPEEHFELSEQEIDDIINGILLYAKLIEPAIRVEVVRDPKDNHVVACAVSAKADYILTRDNDLLTLKEFRQIKIITPEEFLKR